MSNALFEALKVPGGDVEALRAAIAAGASPDAVSPDGMPALHLAIGCGAAPARILIEAGANIEIQPAWGGTPLGCAISYPNVDAAVALIEAGAALVGPNFSALHEASFYGLPTLVEQLVRRGGDPNALDAAGDSVLARAIYTYPSRPDEERRVIELLLKLGATMDVSATKYLGKLKGKAAAEVAALLGAPPPPKKKVKPAEKGAFRHPLFARLEAYVRLFSARPDVEVRHPWTVDTTPCRELDEPYAPDVLSFARSATDVAFSYRLVGEPDAQGFFYLNLAGIGDQQDLFDELFEDGLDECYELDCDREGVGEAAWFAISGGKSSVVWSVESQVRFKTFTDYVTAGARRGFASGWQIAKNKKADAALLDRSLPTSTPAAEVEAALAKGVDASMAADLVAWLGDRAVVLLPRS